MNNFNCYIHFPHNGQLMCCIVQGSVSCVIHPLLLGKVRQSYIPRIFGLRYFMIFFSVYQLRQNARYTYE